MKYLNETHLDQAFRYARNDVKDLVNEVLLTEGVRKSHETFV